MKEVIALSDVITVTVTFHPNLAYLRNQLELLPADCLKIVVDNASADSDKRLLVGLLEQIPNSFLLENSINVGLAAALNSGVKYARSLRPQAGWCLFLDQDSEPQHDCLNILLDAFLHLEAEGEQVGCVGPTLIDANTKLSHGFHQSSRCRWRRIYPAPDSVEPVRCTNINGSGSLMRIDLIDRLGGLDETLFIDHVDTEWSFRVLAEGYTLWGIPSAIFLHRMGENSVRYWLFGWRIWPSRSPARHRFLFRNACWLMQRDYVPFVWKFWAAIKLILTFTMHCIFDPQRGAQIKAMMAGLGDGFKSR